MAEDVSASTTAAAPSPAPPVVSGTPSGAPPDLGGLVQPGAQPNQTTAIQGSMAPFQANEQAAIQKASDLANKSTAPPPPGPHARLLSMVQGLALGLDSFGKAIATHGREGGAEEVQQVQAQQQQQKIQAQAAREASKNSQIQQQLMVADTNHKLAQNVLLMATLPDEIDASHLKVAGEKQTQAITGADFQASHGGMKPDEFSAALSGTGPASSAGGANSFFTTNAQQTLASAKTAGLSDTDPFVQKLQAALADPKTTAGDLYRATSQLQSQQSRQGAALKEKGERDTAASNSTVGKLSTPQALADPGAQAAIQSKIDDPATDPADLPRLRQLIPQAAVAQLNARTIKEREKRNDQLITQGDPDEAGKLLANRSLTLSELKSRQVTPEFIASVVKAAQKYDPNFKPAEADAQAKIAGSASNQQFFGNTDSLLVNGGTLDQLAAAHKALGNGQIPVFNKLGNLRAAAAGSGPQAAYAATILGVADDYAKVVAGGTGSDAARQAALDIINRDQSDAGNAAAISSIRSTVTSQRNGRIGTNPYMKDMYPDPTTVQETPGVAGTQPAALPKASDFTRPPTSSAQAILMQAPGGKPHWIEPNNVKAAQNAGAVEVK